MAAKEALLGALVTQEIKKISHKLDYWKEEIHLPEGSTWTTESKLSLEKFLDKYPLPADDTDIPLYGIAWEFIWGKETPAEIKNAREALIVRARTGMDYSELEKIWLKLILVDTDSF